ncbi:MAG: response regulator transcription factor [Terracidiphilus sp.]
MYPMGPNPIRVGLLAGEPIRLEGLTTVFEQEAQPGLAKLVPVVGSLGELLANSEVNYLIIDLSSPSGRLEALAEIRGARPQLRLIVIGPEDNDELVMDSIVAGARAYIACSAGPAVVREAIEIVISGSIWAPRRVLSQLIDRLLLSSGSSATGAPPRLTDREREVLNLILLARSNREIARELQIEERTVKAHVSRLMSKTGAENRVDLSMWAVNGTLSPRLGARARLKP